MTGHIKDHRKELQSDIWLMPPLYHRLWQYLKYKVNYEDAEIPMHDGTKFKIKRGQHLTSVRSIAQGMGWHEGLKWKEPNPKTISTILDWLVKNGMIKVDRGKGNREYTLVTLIKYEIYQERKDKGNSKGTATGEAREQLADIKKEELRRTEEELKKDIKTYMHFDEMPQIKITESEYKKLIELIKSEEVVVDYIYKFAAWILTQPKKKQETSSTYLSIRNWYKKDLEKAKPNNLFPFQNNKPVVTGLDETKSELAEIERMKEAKRLRLAKSKGDAV